LATDETQQASLRLSRLCLRSTSKVDVSMARAIVASFLLHMLREEDANGLGGWGLRTLFGVAIAGLIVGEIGNFAAFGLASPIVVSPLGAVAVFTNVILSAVVLREPFLLRNAIGLALALLGSVGVVVNAPPSAGLLTVQSVAASLSSPTAIIYLAVVLGVAVALKVAEPLAWTAGGPSLGERFLLTNILICSLLGSITVMGSAAIATFLGQFLAGTLSPWEPLPWLLAPALLSTAVLQLRHLDKAMQAHPASAFPSFPTPASSLPTDRRPSDPSSRRTQTARSPFDTSMPTPTARAFSFLGIPLPG
jgi:uncharacterized membrane protein